MRFRGTPNINLRGSKKIITKNKVDLVNSENFNQ